MVQVENFLVASVSAQVCKENGSVASRIIEILATSVHITISLVMVYCVPVSSAVADALA